LCREQPAGRGPSARQRRVAALGQAGARHRTGTRPPPDRTGPDSQATQTPGPCRGTGDMTDDVSAITMLVVYMLVVYLTGALGGYALAVIRRHRLDRTIPPAAPLQGGAGVA